MKNFSKQKGFSLLEVILVLSLMTTIYLLFAENADRSVDKMRAQKIGLKLHEYQTAVRRFATINSGRIDIAGLNTNEIGSSWLKKAPDCTVPAGQDEAKGNMSLIACNFPDSAIPGLNSTTFESTISKADENSPLVITTVVSMLVKDINNEDVTLMDDSMLSTASLVANGGSYATALSLSGAKVSTVEPYMSSSTNNITYCQYGFSEEMLPGECVVDGVLVKGAFVMITESHPQIDSWVRTDGSNQMNNNLTFNKDIDGKHREIRNIDRIYNVTGKVLKLGNSGVWSSDDGWAPSLGDGVVVDTDVKFVGNVLVDGDIDTKGEVYAKGDVVSEGFVYANNGISTLGDANIAGSAIVLGSGVFQNGLTVVGETRSDSVSVSGFVESQEIYSRGNVYAETAISSPYVRASVALYSEGDLMVVKDSFIGGDTYVGQNAYIKGDTFIDGNLVANEGSSYLGSAFVDAIYDNNGNYMIDPSDISRVNIMRANRFTASEPDATMNMNANSILFAAESESCTTGSAECATSLEGFWDMENLYVRRDNPPEGVAPGWIRLVDWMSEIHQTTENIDNNLDDVKDDFNDNPDLGYIKCWEGVGGAWIKGKFVRGATCEEN